MYPDVDSQEPNSHDVLMLYQKQMYHRDPISVPTTQQRRIFVDGKIKGCFGSWPAREATLQCSVLLCFIKTWKTKQKLAEGMVQAGEVLWPWLPVTEARTVAAGSVRHDVVSTYCGVRDVQV